MRAALVVLVALVAAMAAAPVATAGPEPASVVVLELFTSQSCSSCPPADALLARLAERPEVIALSCHVTYWNHLSWRDTASLDACTERQRAYADVAGRARVFTPELIVNGTSSLVGSRSEAIERTLREGSKAAPAALELSRDRAVLRILVPPDAADADTVVLIAYGSTIVEQVTRGENRGRRLASTNPVSGIRTLSRAKIERSTPIQLSLTTTEQHAAGLVVLLHSGGDTGPIVGAGRLAL